MLHLFLMSLVLSYEPADLRPIMVSNPIDRLAIDLLGERLRLAEMQAARTAEHPEIKLQQARVQLLEAKFQKLTKAGLTPDEKLLAAWRRLFLASSEAEWEAAKEVYTADHPRLLQLEQRAAAWKAWSDANK